MTTETNAKQVDHSKWHTRRDRSFGYEATKAYRPRPFWRATIEFYEEEHAQHQGTVRPVTLPTSYSGILDSNGVPVGLFSNHMALSSHFMAESEYVVKARIGEGTHLIGVC